MALYDVMPLFEESCACSPLASIMPMKSSR